MTDRQIKEGFPSGAIPPLDRLVCQLDLARANEAARAGHYQEADALLAGLPDHDTNPAVLDLLARIRAQQGRLAEAESYWHKALEYEPSNPAYLEGMDYVTRSQRHGGWRLNWTTLFVWTVGILVLVAAGLTLSRLARVEQGLRRLATPVSVLTAPAPTPAQATSAPEPASSPVPVPLYASRADLDALGQGLASRLDASQTKLDGLNSQLATLQAGQQILSANLQSTPLPPIVKMDIPGVNVTPQGNKIVVVFEKGLFLYGWSMDPDMEPTLVQVGQRLKALGNSIHITLIGFRSKDEDPTIDSKGHKLSDIYLDIGQMRASEVLNFLRSRVAMPADLFDIAAQETLAAPFPNDTLENQNRNRTVIFWITRK